MRRGITGSISLKMRSRVLCQSLRMGNGSVMRAGGGWLARGRFQRIMRKRLMLAGRSRRGAKPRSQKSGEAGSHQNTDHMVRERAQKPLPQEWRNYKAEWAAMANPAAANPCFIFRFAITSG